MKKLFLFITCVASSLLLNAQLAPLQWAKNIGGTLNDEGYSIKADASGNVYTTGSFQGTSDFDPGVGTFTLSSFGSYDVFISKLDAAGNLIWAKSFGASSGDYAYSLDLDVSGNSYITGSFQGTVDFDPGIGVFNMTSFGGSDIFVVKLDLLGNFIWAKQFGGMATDGGSSIKIDGSGNVYLTGSFDGTADFDPSPGIFNLICVGGYDIFILKLDSSGNFLWAKQTGGTGYDFGTSLGSDGLANIYITGSFNGTSDFDPGVGINNLTSSGYDDIFLLKLDASGSFIWARNMGGSFSDFSSSIITDVSGNCYTTGSFQSTGDFDPGVGVFNLTTNGSDDVFISKIDGSGNFVWAKQVGGITYETGASIALDSYGDVYAMGYFNGTADFDPSPANVILNSAGNDDIFILKLNNSGNFIWVKQMGGPSYDDGYSIFIDSSNNIYTTGLFQGMVDFDPNAGVLNLNAFGGNDVFVQKMSQCNIPLAPVNVTSAGNQTICSNNTTTLSVTSTGTVNWFATNSSTLILGSGATFITPTLSTGTYTFFAEASTCTISTTRSPVTVSAAICTGLKNVSSNNKGSIMHIYPNPSNGLFTVDVEAKSQIILLNSLGQEILNEIMQEGKKVISLQNQPCGVYYLKVIQDGKQQIAKLIRD